MKKSIAIIGGGPAGLMAAEILSQNFVTVDLFLEQVHSKQLSVVLGEFALKSSMTMK